MGLGVQVGSEVAAGVLLGLGADHLAGTKNRWVVVGALAGVAVAMWTMIRTALRLNPKSGSAKPKSGSTPVDQERKQ